MRNTFDRFNGRHQDYQAARPSYARIPGLAGRAVRAAGALYSGRTSDPAPASSPPSCWQRASASAAWSRIRDMRGAAEALLGGDPRFSSSNGTDHDTGLPDRSVDMVAAAQALHWFDGPAFARECRRIRVPAGGPFSSGTSAGLHR